MKKFNLLVVSDNGKSNEQYLKVLGKVGRRNFVFVVQSLDEADTLLDRLKVDVLLVDLDHFKANLDTYNQKQPEMLVIGATRKMASQSIPQNPDRVKLFQKDEVVSGLTAELKNLRKERFPYRNWLKGSIPRTDNRSDFKNFNQLVVAS